MSTFEEFRRRHESEGATPEGALQLWFEAAFHYFGDDEGRRAAGRQALQYLTLPYMERADWDRSSPASTFVTQLRKQPHLLRSYLKGSAPGNSYQADTERCELNVVRSQEDKQGRGWAVSLQSSGADMPRPVYLKRSTKTNLWFVDNHANVYVGIRPPESPDQEKFV